jgi:flagellar operon protein
MPQVKAHLEKILPTAKERLAYKYSDGQKTIREVSELSGRTIGPISGDWSKWIKEGIAIPVPAKRGFRAKSTFILEEFGIEMPMPIQTVDKDVNDDAAKDSFKSILTEMLRKNSEVNFSKHAVKRAIDHNIELTDENLSCLNEGVKMASEKNLEEPLILVGNTAFLVNIPNNTVITAVDSSDMKGNVFTNIDGTVII